MSPIGRAALKSREGERLCAYRCSADVLTIGVGHTSAAGCPEVKEGMTISAAESDAIFARDLESFETAIAAAIKVPVADHEFDALVSIAFNVGARKFAQSTAIRELNKGRRDAAALAILLWKIPEDIIDRRQAEFDQFRTPYGVAPPKARRSDKKPVKTVPLSLPKPSAPTVPAPAAFGGLFAALRRAFGG